jgi:hypothetical protein
MDKNQPNKEKLSDLKSFKRLSSQIPPKSAGGALNLTRDLHDLVAEDISLLQRERDYETMLKLYEFIVNSLDKLKSKTSGGVKGFILASLDYWQKMLDEKKPELLKRKKKEASRQLPVSDTLSRPTLSRSGITIRRLDDRLKRRLANSPLVVGVGGIGFAHETDYRKSRSERTEQGSKLVSHVRVEVKPTVSRPKQSIRQSLRQSSLRQPLVKLSQSDKQLLPKE